MTDQLAPLGRLLDSGIKVLVYHGMMDMLLPVSGTADALNSIDWKGSQEWRTNTTKKPYWSDDDLASSSELMGYYQSSGNLTFVTVRNAGHLVPIDQPQWAQKLVRDFVMKGKDINVGKGVVVPL